MIGQTNGTNDAGMKHIVETKKIFLWVQITQILSTAYKRLVSIKEGKYIKIQWKGVSNAKEMYFGVRSWSVT
jgi:hypothetical protein